MYHFLATLNNARPADKIKGSRVFSAQQAGKQGPPRLGGVAITEALERNPEASAVASGMRAMPDGINRDFYNMS